MHRFNICLVVVLVRCENTIRPYLFDSLVYKHFWAEDKVGRKGKNLKKNASEFFYLHLIFSDNRRSIGRKKILHQIFRNNPRSVNGQKRGGG